MPLQGGAEGRGQPPPHTCCGAFPPHKCMKDLVLSVWYAVAATAAVILAAAQGKHLLLARPLAAAAAAGLALAPSAATFALAHAAALDAGAAHRVSLVLAILQVALLRSQEEGDIGKW